MNEASAKREAAPSVRVGAAFVVVATLLALFMVDRHGHFITDDAFVSLRYAKNLAAGHGYVFNPGDAPVEGYTNLSHVWLAALAIRTGIEPLSVLRFLNHASFVLLPAFTYLLSWRVAGNVAAAACAAVLVAMHPALAHWSGSGLETASFTLLVTATLAIALSPLSRRRSVLLVALCIAVITTRPDGIVVPVLLGGLGLQRLLSDREPSRVVDDLLGWAVLVGLAAVALFAWRHSLFGYWLPNSAYYKQTGDETVVLVRDFVVQNVWLLALLPFTPWRVVGRRGLVLYGLIAAYVVGFWDVTPSVSSLHRFFLPVFPALAILASASVVRLEALRLGPWRRRAAAAGLLAALVWADLHQPESGDEAALDRAEALNDRMRSRFQLAVVIAEAAPPDASVALGDAGAVGYLLPHYVYDAFGLNDTRFTHELELNRKRYVGWVTSQRPDIIVVVSENTDKFVKVYHTGKYLQDGKGFKKQYRRIAVVPSERRYYYFVFHRPRKLARRWTGNFNRTGPLPEVMARAQARIEAAVAR